MDVREKEIMEARAAGQRALSALTECEGKLESARGMGIWDMFGGNIISGVMKHSRLSEAKACMERTSWELQNFQKELGDVSGYCDGIGITFDGFAQVADFVFDNLLVDALIQMRMKESLEKVRDAKRRVEEALRQLSYL